MKLLAGVAAIVALGALGGTQVEDWGDAKDEVSSSPEYERSKAICRGLKSKALPPADHPDPATAARLKGCDSEALYHGIGVKADPARARQCAILELQADPGTVFAGRTMLMTIYANGVGGRRDLDLATHFACEIDGAPAESHGRVMHLQELKAQNWAGTDFHFCDDVTSGLAMGYCADHEARQAEPVREAKLAQLTAGWSAAEKQALRSLRQAHAAFAEAHGGGEVDLSGTARAAMQIGAEETLRDEFLEMLQSLSSGRAPRYDIVRLRAADAKLNAEYRKRMQAAAGEEYPGAVSRAGIREAQRAWLRYRDAFLALAKVKFPQVSRDGLAAWLTEKRTAMLSEQE